MCLPDDVSRSCSHQNPLCTYQLSCSQKSCLPFSPYLFPTRHIRHSISSVYKRKGTVVRIHSIKEYKGRRGMAPFILNLGTRFRWVASLTSRSLHSRTRAPGNHCIVVWVGLRAGLDILGKIKFPWACSDSNLVSPSPQSRSALRAALIIPSRSVPHFLGVKRYYTFFPLALQFTFFGQSARKWRLPEVSTATAYWWWSCWLMRNCPRTERPRNLIEINVNSLWWLSLELTWFLL
jgi:hypothetical protein